MMAQTRSFRSGTSTPLLTEDMSNDILEIPSSSWDPSASSRDGSSERTTSDTPRSLKRKRNDEFGTSVEAVTATADAFLERLSSTSIPDEEISSYHALTKVKSQPLSPGGENVSRAWEMCISFARRSSQKLKYGRFLRFLSLCFFLIWEKYSDKQGKSAAREVNAKMREAGFTGHSRGLKTMRDETTLINRMVASIQESCGPKQAATLYHVVFEPSNYQLIRTINRLGNEKKSNILEHMCKTARNGSIPSYPTSTTCVQSIIQQYLPNLSTDAISKAIGYQPITQTRQISREIKTTSDVQLPCVQKTRPSASRKRPLTISHNIFDIFDSPMTSADDEIDFSATLDDVTPCDDTFSLDFPNTIDDLEFDFPFSMDGGLSILNEVDHTGLVAS
ncbi:hypothetical protein N7452_008364 [Penicillium brevicompactum]|uniref:Uncharacterized protein n=1 Tax=Penicillium brevicompactum TaxID=5074 RepID=A0A9W9Q6B2_PENBR|nr:hypothetical protein N7452_008364 [Penicillium brevicompactum]